MSLKSVYGSKFFRSAAAFFLLCAMLLPAFPAAHAETSAEAGELTAECTFTLPEDSISFASRLTDERYNSRISFDKSEALEVKVADGAKGIYVAWYAAPEAATIEMTDASGKALASLAANPDLLNDYFALPANCSSVRIFGEKEFAVSEVRVFDTETPPESLSIMAAQQAQPKVMLIVAMTADESYYFGSLLPYLSGDDAALVFLSSESRQAQQEAIAARYALGSRTQPIFGSFPYYPSAIDLKRLYSYVDKGDVNDWLIGLFRRYQPDTLITHADVAEDAIGMHQLTSTHVLIAAEQAADDGKEYISERAYGVWQVRAVYQHQESGTSRLYDTQAHIAAFGGESAVSLAQAAYDRYSSLRVTHYSITDTPYFVQTYPAVEMAQEQSTSELMSLLSSLAAPAALPAAAVTPVPSESPVPETAEEPADNQTQAEQAGTAPKSEQPGYMIYVGAGLALLGVVCLLIGLFSGKQAREEKKHWLVVLAIAIGILMLLGGAGILYRALQPEPAVQAEITPTPAATTPAPTEALPTPTAMLSVPEPVNESEFASHFRKESDPAEVVVFDEANGIYEYRNDTLAVEIRRVELNDPMLAYHIAHIYMREIDSYRSGFGSVRINGRDTEDACVMARRYGAVLGMTGDNLLHSDYNRGMMMRDGRIFRGMTQVSLMALTEDLSMRIYNAKDASMLSEIEEGTQDTFAFGPPLLLNGVLCEDVDQDRVGRINPRAGLGLVEPGHYVAIVADGRLPHYSHGMMLSDFAQLFLEEGCVMAYNLDGGASATLVFMGEYINKRAENHYRSVPDQLLWGYSELVPSEDEAYQLQGLVPQDWRKGE